MNTTNVLIRNSARLLHDQPQAVRGPRHLRPKRKRNYQAQRREGEDLRAAQWLGGFWALATGWSCTRHAY